MSLKDAKSEIDDEGDIFHSVTMAEESSWQQGYAAGVEEGKTRGYKEGYQLGAQKGADIGKEVGFYSGYAAYVMKVSRQQEAKSRIVKVCEAIIKLSNTFVDIEPTDEALTDNLGKIQGKFKQLTSLLGVQVEYKTVAGDNTKGSSF